MDIEAGSEPPPTPGGGDQGMESFFSEVALVKSILERIRRSLVKLQVGLRRGRGSKRHDKCPIRLLLFFSSMWV